MSVKNVMQLLLSSGYLSKRQETLQLYRAIENAGDHVTRDAGIEVIIGHSSTSLSPSLIGTRIPTKDELFPSWAREPIKVEVKVEKKEKPCKDMMDCSYYVNQGDCVKNLNSKTL